MRRANGALYKLRQYVAPPILRSIYFAIFDSHLRYGCQTWGLTKTNIVDRAFTLQKKAVRTITFSDFRTTSGPLFHKLNILPIFSLVKVLNIAFVHDFLNQNLPDETLNVFSFTLASSSHNHNTRFRAYGGLTIPIIKTTSFGEKSLTFQATKFWNIVQSCYQDSYLKDLSIHSLRKLAIPLSLQY